MLKYDYMYVKCSRLCVNQIVCMSGDEIGSVYQRVFRHLKCSISVANREKKVLRLFEMKNMKLLTSRKAKEVA